ncbi:hypothetical protein LB503_011767 [Fusarium chuoi]|nr:hypothetical protein LB503_011767 [Fusarium chuoi]
MPSTKSIAVVATLAASVAASNCKPSKPTTTTAAPTTTSSCPAYTLISEPAEDINCNVRGEPKEGQSQVLESLYLDDCAQKLFDYLWGDTSREEKRLIRKLGMLLQPFDGTTTKTEQISLFW